MVAKLKTMFGIAHTMKMVYSTTTTQREKERQTERERDRETERKGVDPY